MLKEKIIIVTGGSGLLGSSILEDIKEKSGTAINLDLNTNKSDSSHIYCDITDDESIINAIKEVFNRHGRIDGLVNCAYPRTKDWGKTDFINIEKDSWRKNVDWQLNSYFVCCQEVIKIMLMQTKGCIVNIASIYGIVGNDFSIYRMTNLHPPAAYAAIKGAIINFSKYLASKYGEKGIRVNTLSPGGIFDHQPIEFVTAYELKVPMRRMAKPVDIAPGVSFLLSDEANYITGHNLVIDGGYTII